MTNKEILSALNDCLISKQTRFNTINGRAQYVYEVDDNKLHKLISDLEQDIIVTKIKKNSVYGKYGTVKYYDTDSYVIKFPGKVTFDFLNKAQVMFNKNATILKIENFKTVVKCDKEDVFVPKVGLGLALLRYYRKNKTSKKEIYYLEKCLKLPLDELADYCFNRFCNFDKQKINKLITTIEKFENSKWLNI